jgi:hypothetical protein
MAVKANGAKLEWYRYDFAVIFDSGFILPCDDIEEAYKIAESREGKAKFRAVYVTEWQDASAHG